MAVQGVSYLVDGDRVVGDLHLPEGIGPHPAVVVGGPMTSVRGQVTGVYAAALAARGVAALAIDPRHYGDSGGAPRQLERHDRKVADLRAGLDLLAARPEIDPDRLGAAGVCLGAGYAAWVAATDPRIRALGTVVGYYRDPQAMRGGDPKGFQARIDQGVAARRRFEETGEVETIPAAATEGDAGMTSADTVDYYTRRAVVPAYRNELAVMSREWFLPFDVQAAASLITAPTAMVHSENALSPAWARKFHDNLGGSKSLTWITSRGQTDVYDDPVLVHQAADVLARHFMAEL